MTRVSRAAVCILALGCAACMDDTHHGIVGEWQRIDGTHDPRVENTFTFDADGTFTEVITSTHGAASGGCVSNFRMTAEYDYDGSRLTTRETSETTEITGCADASEDQPVTADPLPGPTVSDATIEGNTLTFTEFHPPSVFQRVD